jgi:hypothetical protein
MLMHLMDSTEEKHVSKMKILNGALVVTEAAAVPCEALVLRHAVHHMHRHGRMHARYETIEIILPRVLEVLQTQLKADSLVNELPDSLSLVLCVSLWLLNQIIIFCEVTRHVPPNPSI